MKKWLSLVLLFSAFSSLAANKSDSNFIDCLEKDQVSVNGDCMASHFDVSLDLQVDEEKFDAIANRSNYATAQMFIYPKLGLIRVVADRPETAVKEANLVAKL